MRPRRCVRSTWLAVRSTCRRDNVNTGELTEDADLKRYEVKQGITPELATELGQTPGESFHFVLNNSVVKDNRIPPRGLHGGNIRRRGAAASWALPMPTGSIGG